MRKTRRPCDHIFRSVTKHFVENSLTDQNIVKILKKILVYFQKTIYQQQMDAEEDNVFLSSKILDEFDANDLVKLLVILAENMVPQAGFKKYLFHPKSPKSSRCPARNHLKTTLKYLFPKLVGYSSFVQLTSKAFFPMFCLIQEHQDICEGILLIDSKVLTVCLRQTCLFPSCL
ncbi:hypothetical protein [Candidatus Protochlamydia amoebophila]|nr:hypothetical protein [Candidatus Protochlamydia amoebophila]